MPGPGRAEFARITFDIRRLPSGRVTAAMVAGRNASDQHWRYPRTICKHQAERSFFLNSPMTAPPSKI